jgi:hypothetical protein
VQQSLLRTYGGLSEYSAPNSLSRLVPSRDFSGTQKRHTGPVSSTSPKFSRGLTARRKRSTNILQTRFRICVRFGELILFQQVLVEIRDKVAALKKQGKPLPEVIAAKPGAHYDAEWGNLFQNPSDFIALVYQGV